jgi:hypothetical protein
MRMPLLRGAAVGAAFGLSLAIASPSSALTLTLSDMSSEPGTNPVGDLLADITFAVSGCGISNCTLTVTLDNRTDENAGVTYDINELGFNATFAVFNSPDLTYQSATKNGATDVTAGWSFFEEDAVDDPDTHLDGFGIFDFALQDGVGMSPSLAGPGDMIAFVFLAPAGISDADFLQLSSQTTGGTNFLKFAAAKFINMDPVGFNTCGGTGDKPCDSAYGATAIPEPATIALAGMGLVWLAYLGRRRPRV